MNILFSTISSIQHSIPTFIIINIEIRTVNQIFNDLKNNYKDYRASHISTEVTYYNP